MNESLLPKIVLNSLSEALVEDVEDLLEALVAEVLDPVQAVVGQRHPERLNAVLHRI